MNPPDVCDEEGKRCYDRRQGPGQRAGDIEHQLASSAIALAKRSWRGYVAVAGIVGTASSAGTVLLMLFGLKIGGSTELAAVRTDGMRRDSAVRADALRRDTAVDRWRLHTDSVAAVNALRIANLEEARQFDHFILCNVAEQVGARTAGLCPVSTPLPRKP